MTTSEAGRATDAVLAGLLRAIVAEPDEDTPRLEYADRLDELAGEVECGRCDGDGFVPRIRSSPTEYPQCPACGGTGRVSDGRRERAEFIRVQCRIGALQRECLCGACVKLRGGGQHHNGPCAVSRERDELPDGRSVNAMLRHRERVLWAGFGSSYERARLFGLPANWLAFLPPEADGFSSGYAPSDGDGVVRRGFVSAVTCTADGWLAHADAVLADQPVREVTLTTWPDHTPDDSPRESRVRWFTFRTGRPVALSVAFINSFRGNLSQEIARALLRANWPGVKFTLPA